VGSFLSSWFLGGSLGWGSSFTFLCWFSFRLGARLCRSLSGLRSRCVVFTLSLSASSWFIRCRRCRLFSWLLGRCLLFFLWGIIVTSLISFFDSFLLDLKQGFVLWIRWFAAVFEEVEPALFYFSFLSLNDFFTSSSLFFEWRLFLFRHSLPLFGSSRKCFSPNISFRVPLFCEFSIKVAPSWRRSFGRGVIACLVNLLLFLHFLCSWLLLFFSCASGLWPFFLSRCGTLGLGLYGLGSLALFNV